MSSALAIAGVSAVLTDLLNNGVVDHNLAATVGPVKVSAKPPDRVPPTTGPDPNQLNLFLYHVAPNPGWRNVALPARDEEGARLTNPPLALDLFYLLTAYGEKDFQAEILLGYAMQLFHETPVLTRDAIRTALRGPSPPVDGSTLPDDFKMLAAADLAEQVEQIKIIPQTMSTEEMSKLWTALQTSYRPTAAYQVSVVLIESVRPTRQTLPVRERIVEVIPFQHPTIELVESDAGPVEPIVTNSTIVIKGRQLRGAITSVLIGGTKFIPTADNLGDNQIKIVLPSMPGALHAGIQSVQVVQEIDLGKPPVAHRGVESNVVAFILHPTPTVPAAPTAPGELEITFDPKVGKSQRVTLLLGESNPPPNTPGRSFGIAAPVDNGITTAGVTETAKIKFSLQGIAAGPYFVRAQVDGAESLLTINAAGQFVGPIVTL
jgi:Pvc16 N-terminal domain